MLVQLKQGQLEEVKNQINLKDKILEGASLTSSFFVFRENPREITQTKAF